MNLLLRPIVAESFGGYPPRKRRLNQPWLSFNPQQDTEDDELIVVLLAIAD